MLKLLKLLKKIIPVRLADAIRPAYHLTLGVLGELVYRFPGRKLIVVGVTGTNGKSTTANMIASILEAGGHKIGLITTVNFKIGDKAWSNETKMTSFGRFETYRYLRQMVKAGCDVAILETSSHSLHWHRAWGVKYQVAVITNLTRDHLDLHKTMDAYREAKGKLFAAVRPRAGMPSASIVNADDPAAEYFAAFPADRHYLYDQTGRQLKVSGSLRLHAEDVRLASDGVSFRVSGPAAVGNYHVNMPGGYNVSNALAAVAVGDAFGLLPETIAEGLAALPGVPGRMEPVKAGQPFPIIVDYAHTADAFDKVLGTLRESTPGRLLVVYGATGDRDRGKRPDLGRTASKYADHMFLTEEDPGSEDPAEIIQQILPGIREAGKTEHDYTILIDRRKAIREALKTAKKGDCVVLLAIGHQTVMIRIDGYQPWDDRTVAAEEWQKLVKSDN